MHIVTDYYIGIVQCQASVKTYLEAEGGGGGTRLSWVEIADIWTVI